MQVRRDLLRAFAMGCALLMGTGGTSPMPVAAQFAPLQPDKRSGIGEVARETGVEDHEIALELLAELRRGAKTVERQTKEAYYYAEPIRAKAWCLRCHGEPKGEPDPMFPKYAKDGWKEGEVIGAAVARVAPKR